MTNKNRSKKIISLAEFIPKKDTIILLDTNILINMFTPYNQVDPSKYADLWSRIKKSKAKLIVSSIQVSEFINRCIRIEFALYKSNNKLPNLDYKKDYRSTKDYGEKMDDILNIILEDIVKNFCFVDDKFSEIQHSEIFKMGFSYDFNDALVLEVAKKYEATLITDDVDFANYKMDLPIVTSNKVLLSMRH